MLKSVPFTREQRIINILLLNSSFIDNLGLMHGKMGIILYFFHLARKTENKIYEDYAGELIDEIYDEINTHTPCDYENGLAGIGWGIEYLVQNVFIDADTNEILGEFDDRLIHELTYHTPENIGVLNGLTGYILYFLSRLKGSKKETNCIKLIKKVLLNAVALLEQRIDRNNSAFESDGIWKESDMFDITWDLPSILWVLTELHENRIYRNVVEKIISKFLSSFENRGLYPRLHSNRLLLGLATQKVKQCKSEKLPINVLTQLMQGLLNGLDRETISGELVPRSAFLQNGTSGIAFIYQHLFLLTNNLHFMEESLYWQSLGHKFPESEQGYAGFFISTKNQDKAFGLLNGLAGINLFQL